VDFELDEDQLHLQSAAAEVLAAECPSSYLRSVVDHGHDPKDLWDRLCGLDWPGLALPVEVGGSGATAVELSIVLEQLGHVADPTPFLATVSQFAAVVTTAGDEAQRRHFLSGVVEGRTGAFALTHGDGSGDFLRPPVTARREPDGWHLQGTAGFVLDGDRADEVAVLAGTSDGPAVFVVPGTDVRARRQRCLDSSLHLAEITVDGVAVGDDRRLCGDPTVGAVERAVDEATWAMGISMVGACQRVLDLVLTYIATREQFGVPIGSFQAVKHKAVDMYVAIERARALAQYAALASAEGDSRRSLAASMAKAAAGDAQQLVFTDGIQLFGGIGFTWENDLQLYLRRAKAWELLLGGARHHRRRVGRILLDGTASPTEVLSGAAVL
jgi:alkylation response protein AidB-like acyl-CoA dehydrogenase